jgi:hypothetical protein
MARDEQDARCNAQTPSQLPNVLAGQIERLQRVLVRCVGEARSVAPSCPTYPHHFASILVFIDEVGGLCAVSTDST